MKKPNFKAVVAYICIGIALIILPFHTARAEKQKTIELKFATHIPGGIPTFKVWEAWAEKLEEQSKGRVKVTFYPAQSLVKAKDIYQSVNKGICDIAYEVNAMDPTRFPLTMIVDMPVMGWTTAGMVTKIRKKIYNKFPALQEEFKEVKILWQYSSIGPNVLHLTKSGARIPADLKGIKLIGLGIGAEHMQAIGATPVALMPPDWYMALNRGVVEGTTTTYSVIYDHKVHKLLPYHTNVPLGFTASEVIMNIDKWKSLPSDIQKIMEDLEPWVVNEAIRVSESAIERGERSCKELGHTFIDPTEKEMEKWFESAQPIHERWIAKNEAKGKPARAIMEETKMLIKEYTK